MSSLSPDTEERAEPRWARVASEVLAPGYTVAATVVVIGLLTIDLPSAWWQLLLLFATAAGLPYLFVHGLARAGVWESHHVRDRSQRMIVFLGLLLIEAGALAVLWLVDAPIETIGLLAACVVGVLALALVTPLVRASVHVGVFSVTAGIASLHSWWAASALLALGLLVGAARVAVRDHTRAEVVVGLVTGLVAGLAAVRVVIG